MRMISEKSEKWLILGDLWGLYFYFGLGFAGIRPLVQPIQKLLKISATRIGRTLGSWQLIHPKIEFRQSQEAGVSYA